MLLEAKGLTESCAHPLLRAPDRGRDHPAKRSQGRELHSIEHYGVAVRPPAGGCLPRRPGLSRLRVHKAELGLPWQQYAWLKLRRCRFTVLNPSSVQISVLGTLPRLEFGLASPIWMEVIYSFIQQIFTEYSFWLACDRCLDIVNKEETDRYSAEASFRK